MAQAMSREMKTWSNTSNRCFRRGSVLAWYSVEVLNRTIKSQVVECRAGDVDDAPSQLVLARAVRG